MADETPNPSAGSPESAAEFRAFLEEIGETQSSFARTLQRMGNNRPFDNNRRRIERIADGQIGLTGDMRVIMSIFRHSRAKQRRQAANAAKAKAASVSSSVSEGGG